MIKIDEKITPRGLENKILKMFEISAEKIDRLNKTWNFENGSPVFTVHGSYTTRGWTEWTQGFQFGSEILQFDATSDKKYLESGRDKVFRFMAPHISHTGVHDHGFNNVSTYGNLLRLRNANRFRGDAREKDFYELAIKLSGAVQAARWTPLPNGLGYVYSFNGPHSLFADTIRSMRALALGHKLGHHLLGENDEKINLLKRILQHAETTARYNVYFGEGRDIYDLRGRVAHESIFNINNGSYRCPNSQQGYSPFSTWTRGLAWILLGYSEQLEFLQALPEEQFTGITIGPCDTKQAFLDRFLQVSTAVADFYLKNSPADGIPYWDTGAPGLAHLPDHLDKAADPFNDLEPVDSSAAGIAAQGLLRLGQFLQNKGLEVAGTKYFQAGLTIANTLFDRPYLSIDDDHEGLILHSVYHRPNGWDYIPENRKVPCGESSMWGDYHARELGLYLLRIIDGGPYYTFFDPI